MKITDTESLFSKMGYEYFKKIEPPIQPTLSNKSFDDIIPGISYTCTWLKDKKLYEHQLKALESLEKGNNVVLISGTGSGKTESWALYHLLRLREENSNYKTLSVYPTLALANDQVRRLECYHNHVGTQIIKLDALSRDQFVKILGRPGLREKITQAPLLITNPAFLLHEIKRYIERSSTPLLANYIKRLDFLVLDEIDFYSPRSLALLMSSLKNISKFTEKQLQVAILTATLSNPRDLCKFLEEATGRECSIIEGKPFRTENRTYLVVGKNLKKIWEIARSEREKIGNKDIDKDVASSLENFELFKRNPYRTIMYLNSLGAQVPLPNIEVEEILSEYLKDEGLTIVFTRSIARAEELARKMREKIPDKEKIATHHHLVPKALREEIEEKARNGEIKIIFTPRTLTQGIDIGSVVRIVHFGLPEEVREYYQREGRKGRRIEIPFSESIIVPLGRWDHELLSKGFEFFEKWLSLPIEITVLNKDNLYIHLFTGTAKIVSPWMKSKLEEKEVQALKAAGIINKNGEINKKRAKDVWEKLNFYEYGPPYGIKRYLLSEKGEKPLEQIGRCDVVEKFQIGCFDPIEDAVVVSHKLGRTSRLVTAVVEKPVKEGGLRENEAFLEAIEEYNDIKLRWGERPKLFEDIWKGRLTSEVNAVVYPPKKGFGRYLKVPNRVLWILSSEKPKLARIGEKNVVIYSRKVIYVPTPVHGEYNDYTYGYLFEADEGDEAWALRLGLAFIKVVLRRTYGIPIDLIEYGVELVGEKKFFEIHEPESAGFLEKMDWLELKNKVSRYNPDELDLILLGIVDDIAYSDFVSLKLDWKHLREFALRVIDYLLLKEKIKAVFAGKEIAIPKPSRAQKILVIDGISHHQELRGTPHIAGIISYFDGENIETGIEVFPYLLGIKPIEELKKIEVEIEDRVLYEDSKIIVSNKNSMLSMAKKTGLKRLERILEQESERIIDISKKMKEKGLDPSSIDLVVMEAGNLKEKIEWEDLTKIQREIKWLLEGGKNSKEKARERIMKSMEKRVKAMYMIYHVVENL